MSYSEVKASNVQKECMAIIKWDQATYEYLHKRYRKFVSIAFKYIERGIKPTWWNKNPARPMSNILGDWYVERSERMYKKARRARTRMLLDNHNQQYYSGRAKVLLKLAERALSESNKLDMASIMISAEDAHYLKNTMDKTKEKK